jgi:hypothetical protein
MPLNLLGLFLLLVLPAASVWAQEITPETGEALPLTQSYREEHGSFTLDYPADWLARGGYGQVYLANSQEALDRGFEEAFAPGEVQIGIFAGTLDAIAPDADLPDDATPAEIARMVIEQAKARAEAPVTFSAVETIAIQDQPAAAMTFTRAGTDGYALIIDTPGDVYIALQLLTAPHELDRWLPTALAIAATIPLEAGNVPPPLTDSFRLADESFTIRYPEGWSARAGSPNGVDIASSPEALDLWLGDEFAPGDVHIFIASGSADDLFDLTADVNVEGMTLVQLVQALIDAGGDDPPMSYAAPESFVINDRLAVETSAVQPGSESYMVIIDYGMGLYVVASMQTAVGESTYWQPTLLEMLHLL